MEIRAGRPNAAHTQLQLFSDDSGVRRTPQKAFVHSELRRKCGTTSES